MAAVAVIVIRCSASPKPVLLDTLLHGEVSEWLMVPLSKSGVAQVTGSSNLPLSASAARYAA